MWPYVAIAQLRNFENSVKKMIFSIKFYQNLCNAQLD